MLSYQAPFRASNKGFLALVGLASLLLCATARAAILATPTDWVSPTLGSMGGTTVSLSSISTWGPPWTDFDASGYNFTAAPLASNTEFVHYLSQSSWTATFSQPVQGLLLYVGWWRGNYYANGTESPTSYTFDQPFSIISGLERTTSAGNTLICPDDDPFGGPPYDPAGLHSGVLQFSGSFTSLSVQYASPDNGGQLMTFALPVPEPSTATLLMLSGAFFAFIRKRIRGC